MLIEIERMGPVGRITCDHESTRLAGQDFRDSARQQVHGLRKDPKRHKVSAMQKSSAVSSSQIKKFVQRTIYRDFAYHHEKPLRQPPKVVLHH